MAGLGEDLRAAREARNLTLSDISERIHIRTVYLQGLEDEDWSSIEAPVYARGFLRTYARFLGLDPEESVARFNASLPPSAGAPSPGPRFAAPARRGPSIWLWVVAAVAAALVLFVGYNYWAMQREGHAVATAGASAQPAATEQPSGASANPSGAPSPAARLAAPARATPLGGANGLGVRFVARSWVRVAVDGVVSMEGIYPAGTQVAFHGKVATVRAGNAAGVQVTVDGRQLGTLGPAGSVVERTFKLGQE